MHVAICIVGFRNPADIVSCLEALTLSSHADFEVAICENGGPEAAAALTEGVPATLAGGQAVRIITAERNLGYAGGVNVCLRAAPGADAWWILNPDTRPEKEALGALIARLVRGGSEAVGSTIYLSNGRVESRGGRWRPWLARAESLDFGKDLDAPPSEGLEERLWYLSGASMMIGRRFLEAVGEMREDYFLYGEEVEWCLRARRLGVPIGIAVDSRVLHAQGTTTGSVPDLRRRPRLPVYLDERNKILLTRDHFGARLPIVAVTAFALLCLRFGKRLAWRQLGYAASGWLAGLLNERHSPPWLGQGSRR